MTLKVSSIETTAESVDARGGWGNPKLVTWDFGKEITVTLEDALLSLESARIMLGGKIRDAKKPGEKVIVHYNGQISMTADGSSFTGKIENPSTKNAYKKDDLTIRTGTEGRFINLTQGYRGRFTMTATEGTKTNPSQASVTLTSEGYTAKKDDKIRLFWEVEKDSTTHGNAAVEITISPDTFPGTLTCSAPRGELKNANQIGELLEAVA